MELVENRQSVSKAPQYAIWPPFCQKCLLYYIKQYEINAETNAETNTVLKLQDETIFLSQGLVTAAMYL